MHQFNDVDPQGTRVTAADPNGGPNSMAIPQGVSESVWRKLAQPGEGRWEIAERDATGHQIGTSFRYPNATKSFEPGGKRGLIVALPLPSYAGSSSESPVFICEGASDTAALMTIGLDAVGVPMAGHCGEMVAELLADRHVVIVADSDGPGTRGAAKTAAVLTKRCPSVRIIEPPCGAKDARAAVIDGADADSFRSPAERADSILPLPVPIDGDPIILRMSDVVSREVRWLWEGRIPRGRISLLAGRPGDGKSFVTMDWTARVTHGRNWPDGPPCGMGSVVLVACEDDPHDTIRPRLDAHGADAAKVHLLRGVRRIGKEGNATEVAFTLRDLGALERTLAAVPDCALVIVDPIGSFIGGGVDAHRDNEVRSVLAPLAALAERLDVAVLLIAHQRKGAASYADDLVLGSRAFTGVARSVLHLLTHPDDDERRLLLPGKSNLGRRAAGMAFTIDGTPARVRYEPDPVALTADGVLAAQGDRDGAGRTKRDLVSGWLLDRLAGGPRLSRELVVEALAAGYSERTLNRAKSSAGVKARNTASGWMWELPKTDEGCQTSEDGSLPPSPDECGGDNAKAATLVELAPSGQVSRSTPAA